MWEQRSEENDVLKLPPITGVAPVSSGIITTKNRSRTGEAATMVSSTSLSTADITLSSPSNTWVLNAKSPTAAVHKKANQTEMAEKRIMMKSSIKHIPRNSVDDKMNYDHLRRLEKIFKEGTQGRIGLDIDEFKIAMKKTLGYDIDDEELEMTFMKIDTNCDRTLDWNEYLSYMLLEYQERKKMTNLEQDNPFPIPISTKQCTHIDSVCTIRLLQAYTTRYSNHGYSEPDDSGSRWFTLSKEGILNVWNLDWILQKSYSLHDAKGNVCSINAGTSVTDMVCMPNCSTIAVASTDYEISFYTTMSNIIQKKFQIKGMKYCALTMDYNYDIDDSQKSLLVWGDTNGSLIVIRFHVNPNLSLFSSPMSTNNRITLTKLLHETHHGFQAAHFRNVHNDWIRLVRYYLSKKGLECLISCCVQQETALFFADITEKLQESASRKPRVWKKSQFFVRKGVLCHDYDQESNLIITGSRDCDVRVWNPYVVEKSMAILKGHKCAVIQVLVRTCDHLIVSISKDKNVRVWDLRDYSCKQNIPGRCVEDLGRSEISAAYFSSRHRELVIATNKIGVFHPRSPSAARFNAQQPHTHVKPIISVLYNPLFKLVVTSGEDSTICLWDVSSGTKRMQFSTGIDHEINCMVFDSTRRRLVTGGRTGEAVVWNFNNGEKLKTLRKTDDLELVDVIFTKGNIVTAGWNRHLNVYIDAYGKDEYETLPEAHTDDILSMDYHKHDQILASSSYNGDIFIWSLETGFTTMVLNMHVSIRPIRRNINNKNKQRLIFEKETITSGDALKKMPLGKKFERRQAVMPQETSELQSVEWLPNNLPWLKPPVKCANSDEVMDTMLEMSRSEFPYPVPSGAMPTRDKENRKASSMFNFTQITGKAVYKLLFLQTRPTDISIGNLFAAGTEGWMCLWSIHPQGGLQAYFQACAKPKTGDFVTAMTCDCDDNYLITGDTRGYVRVWDIREYYNGDNSRTESAPTSTLESIPTFSIVSPKTSDEYFAPADQPPKLLISLRCHLSSVTSIAFLDHQGLIASGSTDCSVRLWTVQGRYIGTFGDTEKWNIEMPIEVADLPAKIPNDIRRVASLKTLCTAKGCSRKLWEKVKNLQSVVTALLKEPNQRKTIRKLSTPRSYSAVQEVPRENKSIKEQLDAIRKGLLEETSVSTNRQARIRRESVTVWVDDSPYSIVSPKRPLEMVERTYNRIKKQGLQSKILGKLNYKPKKRHRSATIDPTIRWYNKHPVVFHSLPFVQIHPPKLPQIPEMIQNNPQLNPNMQLLQPIPKRQGYLTSSQNNQKTSNTTKHLQQKLTAKA